ncbi:type II secretion system F family protein [Gluconacetobacter diazotrophicus]|uniref:Secretion system protein n=2 Tax=Gluconacetobacter diazotrophicus TaxID=33996 RepID=A0A7W4I4D2_GLUDI|nr:type II secretion system F family protein [Gluconacetobacter diazotrophicus]MBB2156033.1 secretion system protein [Gluconacetobacter diazotrophicus]TWB10410.1 tight adherence protein B [Gluconacetobacter diazotrophicus]
MLGIVLLSLLMTIFSLVTSVVLLYRRSMATERREGRFEAELGAYRLRALPVTASGRLDHLRAALNLSAVTARVFGFRPESYAHMQAGMKRVVGFSAILPVVGLVPGLLLIGPASPALLLVLWVILGRLAFRIVDRRYAAKLFQQLPDALGMIVRSLRVGIPLSRALIIVGQEAEYPTADEFRMISQDVAVGKNLGDTLHNLAERTGLQEYRFFATIMALQAQTGGTLADVLASFADMIRQRIAARKRGHALASEARMSCYVLGGIPFAIGGIMSIINPDYMAVFLTTHMGHMLLGVSALMLGLGFGSMRFIMKRSLG